MYEKFLNYFTDYIFVKDEPQKADVIFVPGNGYQNYDIFVGGWYSDYNDPLDFLNVMKTGVYDSYGLYSNSEYDSLIDSLTGENDNAKRLEIYQKLEDLLVAQDCGVAPLYYSDKHYYYQNWVKDFYTSSFGASQELYRASVQK